VATLLLVHAQGGPAASYAITKVSEVATVHLLVVAPLPPTAATVARSRCASVVDVSGEQLGGDRFVDRIVAVAAAVSADAVLTFSEFAVVAVARACDRLGLRGAGHGVIKARDKLLMRQTWAAARLPGPAFRAVGSVGDLCAAYDALRPPILLKAAWGAGSIGHMVVARRDDVPAVWECTRSAVASAARCGELEMMVEGVEKCFLAEEIIPSTVRSWYDDAGGYGDYLSVEGMVIDGTYHPVCVTSRLPTIEPFTELSNQAPCVLPEHLQRHIEQVARRAVDALELGTCGTHTELKLMADGGLCLLESSARLGGAMVTREVEIAYGVDLIGSLACALLGEDPGLPDYMQVGGHRRAAASVALLATDSTGHPWESLPVFNPTRVDWASLISPGSNAEVVADLSIPPGTPMPRYDPASGALNFAGLLFLDSPDPHTLLHDTYRVLDGLQGVLSA
jgi:biotin carboxylase